MKNKTVASKYHDTCAFPEVCKYAEVDTEHAHQVALFMWAARANAECDKLPSTVTEVFGSTAWFSQIYGEHRWLTVKQVRALKFMFAIPNGGERAMPVAARLKAEGVKAGVGDIFLPVPMFINNTGLGTNMALNGCGLFLEMKRPEIRVPSPRGTAIAKAAGTVKPEQEAWFKSMRGQGYKTAVAWTFLEALDRIWEYFNEASGLGR